MHGTATAYPAIVADLGDLHRDIRDLVKHVETLDVLTNLGHAVSLNDVLWSLRDLRAAARVLHDNYADAEPAADAPHEGGYAHRDNAATTAWVLSEQGDGYTVVLSVYHLAQQAVEAAIREAQRAGDVNPGTLRNFRDGVGDAIAALTPSGSVVAYIVTETMLH